MSQNTQSFKDGNFLNQDKLDKIIIRNDDSNEIGKNRCLRNKKKRIYQEFETNQLKDSSKGYQTGRWTQEEHKKFIQGLFLYGNDWKQIQSLIETRSCPQARSHAQKFFVKLQRSNFLDLKIDEKLSSVKILLDYANSLKTRDREKLYQKLYEIHCDDEEITLKFSPSKEENIEKKDAVKCNNYNNIHFSNNVNYVNTLNSQSNNPPAKNNKNSNDDYYENNSEKFSNFFSFNHFCQDINKPVNKTKDLEFKDQVIRESQFIHSFPNDNKIDGKLPNKSFYPPPQYPYYFPPTPFPQQPLICFLVPNGNFMQGVNNEYLKPPNVMPFSSFQPIAFPMTNVPIPHPQNDQANSQQTPTITMPNTNFPGYPMVKGLVPLTYTMPYYYPQMPQPGKFPTYNPMNIYQESKKNPSEDKQEGPMIETIKNVTKTVPIIIADRDSVMEDDVPSINNVRNLNSNKVVTKTQISTNNYLDLLHINKKNQNDHHKKNIKQNLHHYKKLKELEEIREKEELNIPVNMRKNIKLLTKKKKINSFKKFKSSLDLNNNHLPQISEIDKNSMKMEEKIKNDHSSDSDVEWDQEIEPYKTVENKFKTLSQTSEILHQKKELSFDHTEDENEISQKLEESKQEKVNNENVEENIINENNIENFIEY